MASKQYLKCYKLQSTHIFYMFKIWFTTTFSPMLKNIFCGRQRARKYCGCVCSKYFALLWSNFLAKIFYLISAWYTGVIFICKKRQRKCFHTWFNCPGMLTTDHLYYLFDKINSGQLQKNQENYYKGKNLYWTFLMAGSWLVLKSFYNGAGFRRQSEGVKTAHLKYSAFVLVTLLMGCKLKRK